MEKIKCPSWEWEWAIHDMIHEGTLRTNINLISHICFLKTERILNSDQYYYVDDINELIPDTMNAEEKAVFLSKLKKVSQKVSVPDDFDKKLRKQFQE